MLRPNEGETVSNKENLCAATGIPEPSLQVLSNVIAPLAYTCIARNILINPPNEPNFNPAVVNFYGKLTEVFWIIRHNLLFFFLVNEQTPQQSLR